MLRSHLALCLLLVVPASSSAEEKKSWSDCFPEIAKRIPNLDRRMSAEDPAIRKRVLTVLTFDRPRDSKAYPPFFRALLHDPSSEIRGLAIQRLWEHSSFLKPEDLPESFDVHFVGEFRWKDREEIFRVRKLAQSMGPEGGWAIQALALVGDRNTVPLAKILLASDNIFVRHSAAMALIQHGEKKDGIDALYRIADSATDTTGFYRYRAAECLYRLGERNAIHMLIDMLDAKRRDGYVDGPREILEDLTGQYFLTADEARAWLKRRRAEPR